MDPVLAIAIVDGQNPSFRGLFSTESPPMSWMLVMVAPLGTVTSPSKKFSTAAVNGRVPNISSVKNAWIVSVCPMSVEVERYS